VFLDNNYRSYILRKDTVGAESVAHEFDAEHNRAIDFFDIPIKRADVSSRSFFLCDASRYIVVNTTSHILLA
jgi:hypothetical protein